MKYFHPEQKVPLGSLLILGLGYKLPLCGILRNHLPGHWLVTSHTAEGTARTGVYQVCVGGRGSVPIPP